MIPSEETIAMLNVNCPELGQFPYELRLKALPPPPEKVTRVNATLGSTCIFSLLVHNYTKEPAEFLIKVRMKLGSYEDLLEIEKMFLIGGR